MTRRTRFVVALYEIDRAYGGPEEGGWWYDTGDLCRVVAVSPTEARACELAQRANRLLHRLQRGARDVSSMAYAGGRHQACVFDAAAPPRFPETRPYYE